MMIEKKNLPDMEDDINNYFTAYKSKLDHNWQEELIWFICKVMPAVQKDWKPYVSPGQEITNIL